MGPRTPSPLHSCYSRNDDIDDDDGEGDGDDRESGTPSPLCSSCPRNDCDVFSVAVPIPEKSPPTGLLMTKIIGVHS